MRKQDLFEEPMAHARALGSFYHDMSDDPRKGSGEGALHHCLTPRIRFLVMRPHFLKHCQETSMLDRGDRRPTGANTTQPRHMYVRSTGA